MSPLRATVVYPIVTTSSSIIASGDTSTLRLSASVTGAVTGAKLSKRTGASLPLLPFEPLLPLLPFVPLVPFVPSVPAHPVSSIAASSARAVVWLFMSAR